MKESKFIQIYNGMTAVAKKVYEATPIQAPWTITKIVGELHREGRQIEHNVAAGCLVSLKDAGLVAEPVRGQFIRATIRSKQDQITESETTQSTEKSEFKMQAAPKTIAKEAQQSPIDKLSALSSKVSAMMDGLKSLANEIENSALEIEEQMQAKENELVKFRQLQALLKGIA